MNFDWFLIWWEMWISICLCFYFWYKLRSIIKWIDSRLWSCIGYLKILITRQVIKMIVLPMSDDVINGLSGFHQSYAGSQFQILSKHRLNSHFLLLCPIWWWKIVQCSLEVDEVFSVFLGLFLKLVNDMSRHSCYVDNVCRIDWSHINVRIITKIFHSVFPEENYITICPAL